MKTAYYFRHFGKEMEFLVLGYFIIFGLVTDVGTGFVVNDKGEQTSFGNETLCQFMKRTSETLNGELDILYPNAETECVFQSDCRSLDCSSKIWMSELKGGFTLNLCKNPPSVRFWKGSFWSYVFKIANESQRIEIVHKQNMEVTEGFPNEEKRWFLTVHLSKASKPKFITLQAVLEICDLISSGNTTECTSYPFLNKTIFSLSQLCDPNTGTEVRGVQAENKSLLESTLDAPSKVDHDRLDIIHMSGQSSHSPSSSHIGQQCNPSNIFFCGDGTTCRRTGEGKGVCECLPNYKGTPSGCIPNKLTSPTRPPDKNDVPNEMQEESSFSAAIGAVMSVIALISLAGFIFLGTKYHFFSRLRNRVRYFRCWPFRRDTSLIDHVSMVNPISSDEDDPPLL